MWWSSPHWQRAQLSYRGSTNTGVPRCTPAKFSVPTGTCLTTEKAVEDTSRWLAPHGLRIIAPFWPPDSIQGVQPSDNLISFFFDHSYWYYFSQLADDLSSHWVYLRTFGTLITFSHFENFPYQEFLYQKKVSPCWTSGDSYLSFCLLIPLNLIHIEQGFWRYLEQELPSPW